MLRNSCASTILGVMFGLLGGALAAEEVAITNHSTAPWRLCRIPSEEVSVFHALPDPAFPEIVIDPGQTWLGGSSSPGTRQFLLKDAAGHHDAILRITHRLPGGAGTGAPATRLDIRDSGFRNRTLLETGALSLAIIRAQASHIREPRKGAGPSSRALALAVPFETTARLSALHARWAQAQECAAMALEDFVELQARAHVAVRQGDTSGAVRVLGRMHRAKAQGRRFDQWEIAARDSYGEAWNQLMGKRATRKRGATAPGTAAPDLGPTARKAAEFGRQGMADQFLGDAFAALAVALDGLSTARACLQDLDLAQARYDDARVDGRADGEILSQLGAAFRKAWDATDQALARAGRSFRKAMTAADQVAPGRDRDLRQKDLETVGMRLDEIARRLYASGEASAGALFPPPQGHGGVPVTAAGAGAGAGAMSPAAAADPGRPQAAGTETPAEGSQS